eukprot:CAMPEP_0118992072 /NCGR_PEP_ID=MMETSP1173-20130426/52751_1 /TAXON_ID=1034831 /ORGANISM="Rhizochromulina marina cf, Strain CCMP1243" /LENGTH=146 /DNA_ID=CAMNT_0006943231 /DNA_START=128 /DNA_END=564 /DNA_ORIENTATION=-
MGEVDEQIRGAGDQSVAGAVSPRGKKPGEALASGREDEGRRVRALLRQCERVSQELRAFEVEARSTKTALEKIRRERVEERGFQVPHELLRQTAEVIAERKQTLQRLATGLAQIIFAEPRDPVGAGGEGGKEEEESKELSEVRRQA